MYAETHRDHDRHPQPFPAPEPLPRPGEQEDAETVSSAYAGDAPAIPISELGSWLST